MTYARFLENKTRMTIKGQRYRVGNPNHPFHSIYKRSGFDGVFRAMGLRYTDEVAKEIKKNVEAMFDKVVKGDVYVMRNPAWPDWYKVGKAISASNRMQDYQTSSPHRDYTVVYSEEFEDRHEAETQIQDALEKHKHCLQRKGEWFKTYVDVIKEVMNDYRQQKEADIGHRNKQQTQSDMDCCDAGC